MVVEEEEEVIGNKVLAGAPQIDRVPVLELLAQLIELLLRYSQLRLVLHFASLSENIIPNVHRELLRPLNAILYEEVYNN